MKTIGIWDVIAVPWPICPKCSHKMEYLYDTPGQKFVTLTFKCKIGCQKPLPNDIKDTHEPE